MICCKGCIPTIKFGLHMRFLGFSYFNWNCCQCSGKCRQEVLIFWIYVMTSSQDSAVSNLTDVEAW